MKAMVLNALCNLEENPAPLKLMDVRPEVQEFTLEEANKALFELKTKRVRGAKVLRID